ncbi:protein-L-isoaspartate(D-aspartate) O-methyltransferase [Granulosicoccaceae sp. 1_MG-2023]|nr:protein-L-isoaspartate(D-aspartate) O-methyltransferase [Granulosicoccaceae sp. 1_MG-2023]
MAVLTLKPFSPAEIAGIGMTSQRTRDRMVGRLSGQGVQNRDVLSAMSSVPRHLFMDEAMASRAYEDVALPIGCGQTISQPYIVARMTELVLEVGELRRVLEIGTGSGYQAAVISRLVPEVYTCERIETLLDRAERRFLRLGYKNIRTRYADGALGWPEKRPFDAIIITASPEEVPPELIAQLRIGGRIVTPLGGQEADQKLAVLTRNEDGVTTNLLESVRFVPFLGGKS